MTGGSHLSWREKKNSQLAEWLMGGDGVEVREGHARLGWVACAREINGLWPLLGSGWLPNFFCLKLFLFFSLKQT